MCKKVLIIGGGHIQLPLIEEGIKLGYELYVIDERSGIIDSSLSSKINVIPFNRHDKENVIEFASSHEMDAVVSAGSDRSIKLMAECATLCGMSTYVSEDSANLPLDKLRMSTLLRSSELPVPQYDLVETFDQAENLAEIIG